MEDIKAVVCRRHIEIGIVHYFAFLFDTNFKSLVLFETQKNVTPLTSS